LFPSTSLFAQEKIITGAITDVNELPTPGVNIAIKGTNKGTQSRKAILMHWKLMAVHCHLVKEKRFKTLVTRKNLIN
jgi:hypothetical protein